MIVLVGFMGSGKTTVGRVLASRLGRSFVDTDRLIEARAGRSIAEMFRSDGEIGFRAVEREIVLEALEAPDAVVALGGGAVNDPDVATRLKELDTIYLAVTTAEALQRIGADEGSRPLLTDRDPDELMDERRPIYGSVARLTFETGGRSVSEVVDEIVDALRPATGAPAVRKIRVGLGARSYDVLVGTRIFADQKLLPAFSDAEKAFVVTHDSLVQMSVPLCDALRARGLTVEVLPIPEGERGKSLEVAGGVYESLAALGAHRHDILVSFGGGVVTDLGGFVGSTFARGMELVHVPTTLLGQVDAAVGGKTGINLARGKNLVGTIQQPRVVLCDVSLIRSCPPEEIRSGMAEVIKYGFIVDPDLLTLAVDRRADIEMGDPSVLAELVARCVSIKGSIVSADERETGERSYLNYGHTFAHAIEAASDFEGIRHGEAVAIGMMGAAFAAHELGRIDDDAVELHRRTLKAVGLPTGAVLELGRLEELWKSDKKYKRGVRFVLLMDIGKPEAGIEVPRPVLEKAVARLAVEAAEPKE